MSFLSDWTGVDFNVGKILDAGQAGANLYNATTKPKTTAATGSATPPRQTSKVTNEDIKAAYKKFYGADPSPIDIANWRNWADNSKVADNGYGRPATLEEFTRSFEASANTDISNQSRGDFASIIAQYPDAGLKSADYGLALQAFKNDGNSEADASRMALDLMKSYGENWVKNQAAEKQITDYVAAYPELAKSNIMSMDEALKSSAQDYFTKTAQPQIEQSLNRRGLLDSGGLNVAMANTLGTLNTQRENITQPMLAQANITGQQQQYETLLRQAQQAGINLQTPSVFQQQFYQPNYNAAQQQVQNSFTQKMQTDQNAYNEAYQARLQKQQQDSMLQSILGAVGGNLLSGGIGAGIGALSDYGAGRGFLSGYSGQWYPNYSTLK